MPALKPGTIIPDSEEDSIINSGIANDPDTYELSNEDFSQLRPYNAIEQVTIGLSTDVIKAFQESGSGWQTRINSALKEWLHDHKINQV